MKKLTLALLLATLILAFAVVPAFAIVDPLVPAEDCNGLGSVGGAAFNKVQNPGGRGIPVHPTNGNVPGACPAP